MVKHAIVTERPEVLAGIALLTAAGRKMLHAQLLLEGGAVESAAANAADVTYLLQNCRVLHEKYGDTWCDEIARLTGEAWKQTEPCIPMGTFGKVA